MAHGLDFCVRWMKAACAVLFKERWKWKRFIVYFSKETQLTEKETGGKRGGDTGEEGGDKREGGDTGEGGKG